MLNELLDYIETSTGLVVGTELFKGYLPPTTDGIAVSQRGGIETDSLMQRIVLSIGAAYNDYSTAEEKITTVYELLAHNNGIQLASSSLFNCAPLSLPTYLTITDEGKHLFTFTFVAFKER